MNHPPFSVLVRALQEACSSYPEITTEVLREVRQDSPMLPETVAELAQDLTEFLPSAPPSPSLTQQAVRAAMVTVYVPPQPTSSPDSPAAKISGESTRRTQ